jgi:hypothetical protein
MLTGSTTQTESRSIDEKLIAMASSPAEQKDDIRLCYVTVSVAIHTFAPLYTHIYIAREDGEKW